MEVYKVPDQGLADTYLIQGAESNPQPDQFGLYGSMYNEGAPDYIIDQGLYYPTGTNYGYICTGYEPTMEWEDQHRFFGVDNQDIHYTVAANENMPYAYYSPNYGYGQTPFNPYNPYIPGAVIGADGSIIPAQQYYALPSYENPVTSASYLPVVFQPRPDVVANGTVDSFIDTGGSFNKADGLGSKRNSAQNTPNSSLSAMGDASGRKNSFVKTSEGRVNVGTGKQHPSSNTSGSITSQAAQQISQIRGPQGTENGLRGKASAVSSQLKTAFTSGNGSSTFESSNYSHASVNKVKPNIFSGRALDERAGPDILSNQNSESRMSKSKNQLVVKAYTTRAGNPDAQGNIIISRDHYNRIDFPVEYANAKFFVIKSYSEDDVHKSIKYNVWSSTPNGNKKLNAAYEDAKRISVGDSRGCPIFLFFSVSNCFCTLYLKLLPNDLFDVFMRLSILLTLIHVMVLTDTFSLCEIKVNASGQFCGIAEMTGPVDFHRDMDFWQQDKWSGSFPVKWHIIKDLPNPNFRHIILENNENKPVTNSRDTQEISFKKGLEMLKIFKGHTSKTSLLDDFMYYENRQRILQGERARLFIKSYENPYLGPLLDPPRKLQTVHDFPPISDVNAAKQNTNNSSMANKKEVPSSAVSTCSTNDHVEPKGKNSSGTNPYNVASVPGSCEGLVDKVPNAVDELKISGLNIHSDEPGSGPTGAVSNKTNSEMVNVVTIGSMPVKVVDTESSGFLTVGTIPLDPRNLLHE
ncbi:YTH domain-containing protein ECT4-like isoform X1 [Salvia splendens]|uniref:YTH domain-containing protein ECT4-like isoform X1 n=2 Tax=Salvia splendens TaxID=180675 RepID=UPI001C27468D|nr:YTH domain-containing protein ECT4-like isoform X1 [Salvia splendens]